MTNKRLGKGLEALITTHSTEDRFLDGAVPIDKIEMDNLSKSIKQNGIIQPLTVREIDDGQYELIAGERRFRAAQMIGLEFVPVYILSVEADVEMMEYALVENIQRVDLNPIEEAEAYAMLFGKYDLSHDEIAQRVGKSRSGIANCLRLLKLPPSIKLSVKTGAISAGHARALLSLRKSLQMMTLYQKVLKEGLSVRQTEVLSKKYTEKSSKKILIKKGSKLQIQVKDLENSLISSLGAKVVVKHNKKGKGKIYIDFDDDDDLQRIIKIITVKK